MRHVHWVVKTVSTVCARNAFMAMSSITNVDAHPTAPLARINLQFVTPAAMDSFCRMILRARRSQITEVVPEARPNRELRDQGNKPTAREHQDYKYLSRSIAKMTDKQDGGFIYSRCLKRKHNYKFYVSMLV